MVSGGASTIGLCNPPLTHAQRVSEQTTSVRETDVFIACTRACGCNRKGRGLVVGFRLAAQPPRYYTATRFARGTYGRYMADIERRARRAITTPRLRRSFLYCILSPTQARLGLTTITHPPGAWTNSIFTTTFFH